MVLSSYIVSYEDVDVYDEDWAGFFCMCGFIRTRSNEEHG